MRLKESASFHIKAISPSSGECKSLEYVGLDYVVLDIKRNKICSPPPMYRGISYPSYLSSEICDASEVVTRKVNSVWTTVNCSHSETTPSSQSREYVFNSADYFFIYCPNETITINDTKYDCPNYSFKLPREYHFTIKDKSYGPITNPSSFPQLVSSESKLINYLTYSPMLINSSGEEDKSLLFHTVFDIGSDLVWRKENVDLRNGDVTISVRMLLHSPCRINQFLVDDPYPMVNPRISHICEDFYRKLFLIPFMDACNATRDYPEKSTTSEVSN